MTPDGLPRTHWDLFVSYTHADRTWAEWIAWELEKSEYSVLVQAWDFVPGSNWIGRMQDGVQNSDRTIAVLSPDYLESEFCGPEWQAAWAADPAGQHRKLLVVRVSDCDRPGFLAGVVGRDLFGLAEPAARRRLTEMVAAAVVGRDKPPNAPLFPSRGRRIEPAPEFPGNLPTVWNVPPSNPNFVGRHHDLTELVEHLRCASMATVHSLHGLGGIGKTQLAIQYAHKHAREYCIVWWFSAEEPTALPNQFAQLGERLNLAANSDPMAVRIAVHEALRREPSWLLIFDNADSVGDIREWLPSAPTPSRMLGHVLVTTRRGGFKAIGRVHDVDIMRTPDAIELLRTRVPQLGDEIATNIAKNLGRLPLALEQASAYIDRTGISGDEYLNLILTRADLLFAQGHASREDRILAGLWDISFERVGNESPAALQLLHICSYLAPEPIPLELFTANCETLPQPLGQATADPLEFVETVAVLNDYSLAKRSGNSLQLHRLVQAALRTQYLRFNPGQALPTEND